MTRGNARFGKNGGRDRHSTLRLLRRWAECGRLAAGDADGQGKDRGADRGGPEGEKYDPKGAGGGSPRVGPGGQ